MPRAAATLGFAMGLDTVELIMDVEDRLQVDLPDDLVAKVRTVQQHANFVIPRKSPSGFSRTRASLKI